MPSEPRGSPDSVVRADGWLDRRRSRLRHLALRPDHQPTRHSTVMISPAPNNYPSGTRPEAVGAGVQFATASPSWDEGYSSGLPARADDDAEQVQGGSVAFTFSRLARASLGLATQAMERLDEACPGKARQQRNPERYLDQFLKPRRDVPSPGRAGQGWARQHRNPRRYSGTIFRGAPPRGFAGQVQVRHGYTLPRAESGTISKACRGAARHALACLGNNVTVDGNHGHFPKHQEAPASRGATVDGMTGSV